LGNGSEDVKDKIDNIFLPHQYSAKNIGNDHCAEMVCIGSIYKGDDEDSEVDDEDYTKKTVIDGEDEMTQIP